MNFKIKNEIKILIKSVSFFVLFAFAINAGAVWTSPLSSAPGNNTKPPINEGTFPQLKKGNFTAQGLRATSNAILEGTLLIPVGVPPLEGKVLTSDALGFASWQIPTFGGGGGSGEMINPMTTLGDMIYGQVSGVPTRLPIESATRILKVVANKPDWEPAPAVGANGWTDDGTVVRLTTSTDKVGIGTDVEDVLTDQVTLAGNMRLPNTSIFYVNGSGEGVFFKPNNDRLSGRFMNNRNGTYIGERAGSSPLGAFPIGTGNTGIGAYVLIWGSDGENNTGLGDHVLINTSLESNNTAIGSNSVGNDNINNVSIGENSLRYVFTEPCCNTTQQYNSTFGNSSMFYQPGLPGPVTRNYNTSLGHQALDNLMEGSNNTALGYSADIGSNNLFNTTVIGSNAVVNINNAMVFGTSDVVGWGFGTQPGSDAITVNNGARLTQGGTWTDVSDRNKKDDILNTKYGLNEILALRPVDYKLKINDEPSVGFIAQEVKEVIPEVVYGKDGEMTMSYSHLTAILTKAVQELKEENEILKYETSLLEKELE